MDPVCQVVIRANAGPQGGNLTVSPRSGSSLSTAFSLGCWGWATADGGDEDLLPLRYQFLAYTSSSAGSSKGSGVSLAGPQLATSTKVALC